MVLESPKRKIPQVVILDDYMMDETTADLLTLNRDLQIVQINTGLEFYEAMEGFRTYQPDLVLGEINLPGRTPGDVRVGKDLPDFLREGYQGVNTVGLRCLSMLKLDAKTRAIPQIIYTVWDEEEFSQLVPAGIKSIHRSTEIIGKRHVGSMISSVYSILDSRIPAVT